MKDDALSGNEWMDRPLTRPKALHALLDIHKMTTEQRHQCGYSSEKEDAHSVRLFWNRKKNARRHYETLMASMALNAAFPREMGL